MPTRTDKQKTGSTGSCPAPKSFAPQVQDGSEGNAWNRLRDLTNRDVRAKADDDTMIGLAQSNIRARLIRNRYLPDPMFGEPAWDMLLALYVDSRSNARQTVSRLSKASGAPATTALRWIDYLEREGFVCRRTNPTDRRVVFIEMTDKARQAIEAYLIQMLEQGIANPAPSNSGQNES